MNLGTAITLLIVGAMLFFAMRSIVRDFRSGKSKCSECGNACGRSSSEGCEAAKRMAENLEKI
ncbi:MAG: FeoB-associated Cys-rich membrane protein [Eggerthellaceae bacterium]|nr:FeoB-associated Cys-rich membrane protein [Eggerthellaceae bacterium]